MSPVRYKSESFAAQSDRVEASSYAIGVQSVPQHSRKTTGVSPEDQVNTEEEMVDNARKQQKVDFAAKNAIRLKEM